MFPFAGCYDIQPPDYNCQQQKVRIGHACWVLLCLCWGHASPACTRFVPRFSAQGSSRTHIPGLGCRIGANVVIIPSQATTTALSPVDVASPLAGEFQSTKPCACPCRSYVDGWTSTYSLLACMVHLVPNCPSLAPPLTSAWQLQPHECACCLAVAHLPSLAGAQHRLLLRAKAGSATTFSPPTITANSKRFASNHASWVLVSLCGKHACSACHKLPPKFLATEQVSYSCPWLGMQDWGKCGDHFITSNNYCALTCGRCSPSGRWVLEHQTVHIMHVDSRACIVVSFSLTARMQAHWELVWHTGSSNILL
jgi:hypothetical protein